MRVGAEVFVRPATRSERPRRNASGATYEAQKQLRLYLSLRVEMDKLPSVTMSVAA